MSLKVRKLVPYSLLNYLLLLKKNLQSKMVWYELNDRDLIPGRCGDLSISHRVRTDSGAH